MSGVVGPRLSSIPPTFFNDYSFEFDGISEYAQPSTQTSTEDTSFSCWIKTTETFVYTDYRCAFGGRASVNGGNYTLGRLGSAFSSPNDMKVRCFNTLGTTKLNDDMWHHIVFTHDFTTKETKAYVDGNLEVTVTFPANSNLFNVAIGWNGFASSTFFEGSIDECAWFTSVLTPSVINTIYGTGTPNDLTSLSPYGWWRNGDNSLYKYPQWLLPSNENKDKVSNYSMSFDGTDDYINSGVISDFVSSSAFSVSGWFYFDSVANHKTLFSYGLSTGSQYCWTVQTYPSGNLIFVIADTLGDSGYNYIGTSLGSALVTGQWYNICIVYDGSGVGNTDKAKIYINGTEATYSGGGGTIPATTTASTGYFNIGRWDLGGSDRFFNGNIDEVSIYDSALSSGNITSIYNSGTPTDLTSLNPVAYYKMGENATLKDPQWLIPNNENKDKFSNYSMSFDGTDDYMSTSVSSLNSTTAFTISFWAKKPTATDQINVGDRISTYQGMWLNWYSDGNVYYSVRRGANESMSYALSFDTDWHHFVGTFDNGLAKLYIDGSLVNTFTFSTSFLPATTGDDFRIGAIDDIYFGTGNIDEVGTWDVALGLTEITELYNSGTPIALPSGALSHWKMGDDATFSTNWTIPDQVGGNDGTSANMDINDRVGDAPSSSGNTVSYNMDINDRVGDAPNSENNALSYNMVLSGRTSDVPT